MQRELAIEIKNGKDAARSYTIKIPTAGQLVDIETYKSVYTQGNYGKIVMSATTQANDALDLVDMNANLRALCPDLLKDWGVQDLFELDIFDIQLVKKVYDGKVLPWMKEWQSALQNLGKEESK